MEKNLVKFVFELGQLRRISHEGWKLLGISHPDNVAEHSLRAAQIGFILAKLENYDNPNEICSILVFHDIGECRIGDLHKVANRYLNNNKEAEEKAVKEQTKDLGDIGNEIYSLWKQIENKDTQAGIIAKDGDLLEQAFTAKEYMEQGYIYAEDWINKISKRLKTKSAINLLNDLKTMHSNEWWQGLKKIPE